MKMDDGHGHPCVSYAAHLPHHLTVFTPRDVAMRYGMESVKLCQPSGYWLRTGKLPPMDVHNARGELIGWTPWTLARFEAQSDFLKDKLFLANEERGYGVSPGHEADDLVTPPKYPRRRPLIEPKDLP